MRICLCIPEDDLRAWVMEELALSTWVVLPTVETVADLAEVDPGAISLLVLGVDRLTARDLDLVRSWAVPVIAIGADAAIPGAYVLGPRLTSRELKHALRGALSLQHSPKSAVV